MCVLLHKNEVRPATVALHADCVVDRWSLDDWCDPARSFRLVVQQSRIRVFQARGCGCERIVGATPATPTMRSSAIPRRRDRPRS